MPVNNCSWQPGHPEAITWAPVLTRVMIGHACPDLSPRFFQRNFSQKLAHISYTRAECLCPGCPFLFILKQYFVFLQCGTTRSAVSYNDVHIGFLKSGNVMFRLCAYQGESTVATGRHAATLDLAGGDDSTTVMRQDTHDCSTFLGKEQILC